MNTELMFSNKSNEWETPNDLYEKLNDVFHFTLDPSSTDENHKTNTYFTIKDDGLSQKWGRHTVFCNPPYGRGLNKWIKKCYEEGKNTTVVMLVPSRTDTKAMQRYCLNSAKIICFLKGRCKFINRTLPSYRADGKFKASPAPFPSLIAVYTPKDITKDQFRVLDNLGVIIHNDDILNK